MLEHVLQIDPGVLGLFATVLSLGTTVLGLLVGYIAYRGYRRGSRPMLYVAVGFVLVFWTPLLLFVGNLVVAGGPEFALGVVGEASKFAGLLCILYGLRMPGNAGR